jgi:hypothetical protein
MATKVASRDPDQVRLWLEEVGLGEVYPRVKALGLHSPEAFVTIEMPQFELLGPALASLPQRRALHRLILRLRSSSPSSPSPSIQSPPTVSNITRSTAPLAPSSSKPTNINNSNTNSHNTQRVPKVVPISSSPTLSSPSPSPPISSLPIPSSPRGKKDIVTVIEEDEENFPDETSAELPTTTSFYSGDEDVEDEPEPEPPVSPRGTYQSMPLNPPKAASRTITPISAVNGNNNNNSTNSISSSTTSSPSVSTSAPPSMPSGSGRAIQNLRVSVCVRKRPLVRKELEQRERDIVFIRTADTIEVHEPKIKVDLTKYTDVHKFVFDQAFNETDDNAYVYERTAKPLIANVFRRGARVTCFCYGQTGSGKTHTMMGKKGVDGLYALAAKDIFQLLESGEYAGQGLAVSVSLFEIYGNKLFDLLNDRKKIVARQNAKQEVCIIGLTERVVGSAEELLSIINKGNQIRATAATGVHAESSRSHAILQISIKSPREKTKGMFSFIDLAGSEKGNATSESGRQTRIEGAEINKSLLALKECIRALDRSQKHAPFRQSTLTQVLKDSFVGTHSRTIMIANIAPNSASSEHTLNTLRYADRVRELRGSYRPSNPSFDSPNPIVGSGGGSSSPAPKAPAGRGSGGAEKGEEEMIVDWHRDHLMALRELVRREEALLEEAQHKMELRSQGLAVPSTAPSYAEYKSTLNDILIEQAMLYANIPKCLDG